jgi:hypothetical protein
MLRELAVVEGVGEVGLGAAAGAAEEGVADVGAPALAAEAHSDSSTWPPDRQIASSASKAVMYF